MSAQQTSVLDLPYYETLCEVLAPYIPASETEATAHFSSSEIISSIERHHGVPQGVVGKEITNWVLPEDFVRAMRYKGFREVNAGGLELHWPMKKKV